MTDKVSGFYYFDLAQHAMYLGWELDESLDDFFSKHPDELETPYSTCNNEKRTQITLGDVLKAASGNFTDKFKEYMVGVNDIITERKLANTQIVFSAMHSGASDYLFAKNIRDFVEQVCCGSNADSNPAE